ncbi:cytochrome c biogenesis protein ResB [soil metagenome]
MSADTTAPTSASAAGGAGEAAQPPGGGRVEPDGPVRPRALSARELGQWVWRQLTSMRTALLLLLLLALAAVPGSLVPQEGVDSLAVARFQIEYPALTPWLERLGMFSVYASPWFSAIYLLLLVSLVGCIVPRTAVYARALRARPPRAPSRLDRLPAYASFEIDAADAGDAVDGVDDLLQRAARVLRRGRFRVDVDPDPAGNGVGVVRAERGYLREAGNLVFHVSLVAVLVGVAVGSLWGYRGNAIVVEGRGFSNTLTQYDEFTAGALTDASSLPPFTVSLEQMTADFQTGGAQVGQPKLFGAAGTVAAPGAAARDFDIAVNHPLEVDGTSVFLVGSGYAPVVTVRDGAGEVVTSGPVPFLPTDASYVSEGVIKVPDAQPSQLGMEGFFLPTAGRDADGVPISLFPEAADPALSLFVYAGDLGLDDGAPQSVYSLNTDDLQVIKGDDGKPERLLLQPGQRVRLPDGLGSVTFDGVAEFARLQISSTPLAWLPLAGLIVAVSGLLASLYVRPRRAWVRTRPAAGGRRLVEVALLDRVARVDPRRDLDDLVADLQQATEPLAPDPGQPPKGERR